MSDPIRRPEAEIIPPGEPLRRRSGVWHGDDDGTYRVRMVRLGPLGATLLTLGIAAAACVLLFLLLGAALVGVAAVGLAAIGAGVASLLRGPSHRLR